MGIDAKERWLLERVLATVHSDKYSERDVLALLILLRKNAGPDSAVHEFGDFVAHREKDRGILQNYLRRVQSVLQGQRVGESSSITLPVFTATDLYTSFNTVFGELGFDPIDAELANRLSVCIISLLQSVQVDTRLGMPVHGFAVGISSTHVALLGHGTVPAGHVFQFPLLTADNNGYEASLSIAPVEALMRCHFIVEAYCSDGKFRIAQTDRRA